MNDFIDHASKVRDTVTNDLEECLNTTKLNVALSSLRLIQENISQCSDLYEASSTKQAFSKIKKSLVCIGNTVDGLIHGLEEREISKSHLRKISSNITTRFVPELAHNIARYENRQSIKVKAVTQATQEALKESLGSEVDEYTRLAITQCPGWVDSLKIVKGSLTVSNSDEIETKARSLIENVSNQDSDLETKRSLEVLREETEKFPIKLKSAYSILKGTVVPIIEHVGDFNGSLEKAVIKRINIQGYYAFPNQLLLAVSKSAVDTINRPLKKKSRISVFDYARSVLSLVNEKSTQNFSFVTDKHTANPRNADILLFWLLPTSKLNYLIRTNHLKIKNWELFK